MLIRSWSSKHWYRPIPPHPFCATAIQRNVSNWNTPLNTTWVFQPVIRTRPIETIFRDRVHLQRMIQIDRASQILPCRLEKGFDILTRCSSYPKSDSFGIHKHLLERAALWSASLRLCNTTVSLILLRMQYNHNATKDEKKKVIGIENNELRSQPPFGIARKKGIILVGSGNPSDPSK